MRRRITVEVDGSIFVLRGWQAHRFALEAGLRPTYSGVRQGWMADTSKLSTFEAYCAHRNIPLDVEDLSADDRDVPSTAVADTPQVEDVELSLFDPDDAA